MSVGPSVGFSEVTKLSVCGLVLSIVCTQLYIRNLLRVVDAGLKPVYSAKMETGSEADLGFYKGGCPIHLHERGTDRTLLTASALKPLYAEVFAVVSVAVTIKLFSSSWRNPTSRCSNVF